MNTSAISAAKISDTRLLTMMTKREKLAWQAGWQAGWKAGYQAAADDLRVLAAKNPKLAAALRAAANAKARAAFFKAEPLPSWRLDMIHVAATAVGQRFWDADEQNDPSRSIKPRSVVWVLDSVGLHLNGPMSASMRPNGGLSTTRESRRNRSIARRHPVYAGAYAYGLHRAGKEPRDGAD